MTFSMASIWHIDFLGGQLEFVRFSFGERLFAEPEERGP